MVSHSEKKHNNKNRVKSWTWFVIINSIRNIVDLWLKSFSGKTLKWLRNTNKPVCQNQGSVGLEDPRPSSSIKLHITYDEPFLFNKSCLTACLGGVISVFKLKIDRSIECFVSASVFWSIGRGPLHPNRPESTKFVDTP